MHPVQAPKGVLALLDLGYRLELAMAQLYQVLAKAHTDSPAIASLWRKTAMEEEQHAAQFRLAQGYSVALIADVIIEWGEAQQMLDAIEELVQRYEASPPAIPEALKRAIRMEESMAHVHLDRAFRFNNDSHQRLFAAMMAADQEHIETLKTALRGYAAGSRRPDRGLVRHSDAPP